LRKDHPEGVAGLGEAVILRPVPRFVLKEIDPASTSMVAVPVSDSVIGKLLLALTSVWKPLRNQVPLMSCPAAGVIPATKDSQKERSMRRSEFIILNMVISSPYNSLEFT
jgi:hypothetical protein